jgi:hypothetical protein
MLVFERCIVQDLHYVLRNKGGKEQLQYRKNQTILVTQKKASTTKRDSIPETQLLVSLIPLLVTNKWLVST